MIGVIDVGGGLRGSYGAGVLDWCMDNDAVFDYGIGVSAGSANIASYLAHQRGRNYTFYTEYMSRPEYIGWKALLKTKSYVGLEYIYGDLSDSWGEYPLDWQKIKENPAPFKVVATNAYTGLPVYFDKAEMRQDEYMAIKASCNVPVVDRPYKINGVPYYDGGISDPVPYKRAMEDGCDRLVIILTRPKNYRRIAKTDEKAAHLLSAVYPSAGKDVLTRGELYNRQVDEVIELEKQGKVLIVAPSDIGHMKTLTKDVTTIRELYLKGYHDADAIANFMAQQ
ncbi:MAG: patatin family protein [Solobacterium sp.]|jgi:predicted patatin/cPLA2 family phospholipase|nr:patatin family protein [Solobacterium sp.]MCH4206362.1 patatin family protein [Solobacterium sp.]MCH4227864.1 patatin family protein [Solobacterium sp.]MCH4283244.1 patatin family protein [Solobacterium sp.]